ncbi:hypothetical protein AVJ28_gp92 [Mycobacterium phage Baee]|uniref:Uncharacterized protein n=1 Tax=Mycobacterium phage Baee TaxID=1647306 RepID=A0A0F6YQP9_9CAUD|nr:hypothetical protein AVJ28_gp92 [Mycobacterium phage Baee]AKF14661.1 hypothetical protein SEA_BAEE_92 [Mycobacterium phage Baee]
MSVLFIALVGISGVLLGMSVLSRAEHGSAREWVGATIMLTSVLTIPVGAAIWSLP